MLFTTSRAAMICCGSTTAATLQIRRGGRHQIEDAALLRLLRITDVQLEHEAIELRFGKLISAFLLERILRRENEKRIGQRIRLFADRDLAFLHRFEQARFAPWPARD